MSELRINAYRQVHSILEILAPFIRFKRIQVEALLEATEILSRKTLREIKKKELSRIVDLILIIQSANYGTRAKKTKKELSSLLGLTPYRLNSKE